MLREVFRIATDQATLHFASTLRHTSITSTYLSLLCL